MTTITCSHPQKQVEVRRERIPTTDNLLKYEKPRPFCTGCESYLPVFESPGRELVTFFFIREDRLIRAQAIG